MSETIADHIGLVHHVINRLGIPEYMRDEAYSEGLVVLAVAGTKYDPERGVPMGAFLAKRVRWGLKDWIDSEIKHRHLHELETANLTTNPSDAMEARRELDQLIHVAAKVLNIPEYTALLGMVYGAREPELSNVLKKNGAQLEALRMSARAKLKHEMRLL